MRLTLILAVGLTISGNSFSQVGQKEATAVKSEESFEQFCLKNAVSIIQVPKGKDVPKLEGTVQPVDKMNPTYIDYGVTLKEDAGQYFAIAGSDKLLKVNSIFCLKLAYNQK